VLAVHGKDVGTDYDAIVRSANFNSVIGESEADVGDLIARLRARQVPVAGEAAVDAMLANVRLPESATAQPNRSSVG
jgi:hypothetical protein